MKYIPLLGFQRRCIVVSGDLLVPKFIYFAGSPRASGQRFWKNMGTVRLTTNLTAQQSQSGAERRYCCGTACTYAGEVP